MRIKRFLCVVLACAAVLGCFGAGTGASAVADGEASAYATGKFSMDVSGGKLVTANTSFPLEVGEIVAIKASYSPFSASVDFGLIAPDGLFYYVTVTNGSIDQEIEVSQRGNYTFAVRNNSSNTISVSGFVNY